MPGGKYAARGQHQHSHARHNDFSSISLHFHHFLHDVWQRDIYTLLRDSFLDALLRHKLNHLHCLLHCLEAWHLTLHHNFKHGQERRTIPGMTISSACLQGAERTTFSKRDRTTRTRESVGHTSSEHKPQSCCVHQIWKSRTAVPSSADVPVSNLP